MKKFRKVSLQSIVTLLISCIGYMLIFSATAVTAAETVIPLFNENFDNVTVGSFPDNMLYQTDSTTPKGQTVVNDQSHDSNYLKFPTGGYGYLVRALFDGYATSGMLCIEMDIKTDAGVPKLTLLNKGELTTLGKYVWCVNSATTQITFPCTSDGIHYTTFKNETTNESMMWTHGQWNHIKLMIDLDNNSVVLVSGDETSAPVTDSMGTYYYDYLDSAIAGIGIYPANSECINMSVDNIEIYNIVSDSSVIYNSDFEDETEGAAPTSVVAMNGNPFTTTTDACVVNEGENKYLTVNIGKNVKAVFDHPVSNGQLVIGLDMKKSMTTSKINLLSQAEPDSGKFRSVFSYTYDSTNNVLKAIEYPLYNATTEAGETSYWNEPYKDMSGEPVLVSSDNMWHHIECIIDLDKKSVKTVIGDIECQEVTNIKYIEDNDLYLPLTGININVPGSSPEAVYVDNIVVSHIAPTINTIVTGSNRVKLSFDKAVNTFSVSDINVQNAVYHPDWPHATKPGFIVKAGWYTFEDEVMINSIEMIDDNTTAFIEFADEMADGGEYLITLSDTVKYMDDSAIDVKSKRYTFNKGSFEASLRVSTIAYNQSETPVAECKITTTELTERTGSLFLAGYKDGMLIQISEKNITVTKDQYGEIAPIYLGMPLTESVTMLKVFLWDVDTLVPYCDNAKEEKTLE